ncbi:MAG: hypothetical protein ABSF26_00515 [Thermoguttaceae bacterium]
MIPIFSQKTGLCSGAEAKNYPRERRFRVSLDVKTLTPAADLAHLQVRALAGGGGRDLGPVATVQENGRLVLTAGTPGAGRYVIAWKSR